ncbi:MAG: DoxX family protein [Candidatus Paceibacterota bacterium]
MEQFKQYSPIILRIGLALVFLWFGFNQISDPVSWYGFVPASAATLTGFSIAHLVFLNGIFEIIAGTALAFGFFTRIAAGLLFLHILDIAFIVGLDSIGIRDLGLSVATFVIFLNGMDRATLDHYIRS